VFGKNGISKVIMKNMIPLLNQELYRLLIDSCYFILELNVNDKNEVEFIMIDSESRIVKPLNSGSGYEKTISSLALRSVLTKISSLPKPNIVVMDEVFGKIADENLEMVGEFFKKIKEYFDHVIVISHNPLIRNWSDNIIMIKKEENVSSIDYIKIKI
jgi:DNA repair exonuclease SbcCD ATPase subunit